MFKLSLAIISAIMWVPTPFEESVITHTQGLFVCNIQVFCRVILKMKIFKGLH